MEDLFPYQIEGHTWLADKKAALLADEMGLGKTVQAIRGLDSIHAKNILVICPAIARVNWAREFEMWSLTGIKGTVLQNLRDKPLDNTANICSFDYATENYQSLSTIKWDALIVDESHFLKGVDAKRSRAILGRDGIVRSTKRTWLLTGTPAPNHAGELWIILYTFGLTKMKHEEFIQYFCMTRKTSYGIKVSGTNQDRIPELKQLLNPIMLRRLKKDVMKELPDIFYSHLTIEPGLVNFDILPSFAHFFIPTDRRKEMHQELSRQEKLLKDVFSNMKKDNEDALGAINSIADSISTIRRFVGLQKVEAVVETVKAEFAAKKYEKLVIFATHRDVIEGLREGLKEFKAVTLYGGTPPEKRQRNIDKFQRQPHCKVFIGNILAAGTAVTLTAAHDILIVEPDWVPGNNAQAVMRVHRIGQKETVSVRFVNLANSLDQQINYILSKKTKDLTLIFDEKILQDYRQKTKS